MSYYHHLFEAYVDEDTRSTNTLDSSNQKSLNQATAADRLQAKIWKGDTLVRVTVKNLNAEYWKNAAKENNPA